MLCNLQNPLLLGLAVKHTLPFRLGKVAMVVGPMDHFLARAAPPASASREEEAPSSASESDEEIERPSDGEEEAPPDALTPSRLFQRAGTLEGFVVRREAAEQAAAAAPSLAGLQAQRQRPLSRAVAAREAGGHLGPAATAAARHRGAACYRLAAALPTHSAATPALSARGQPLALGPGDAGPLRALSFDSQGELLAAGSEQGLLTIHATAQLLGALRPGGGGAAAAAAALSARSPPEPVLALAVAPNLRAVAWNPADENVVGVAAASSSQVALYDLQHTRVREEG